MISCICATGSTEINSPLRADLLWRMVNSMHNAPGEEFELIIIDNCHGEGPHRSAIRQIAETYATVTHVVWNRWNEFHGGGVNQGIKLSDGDIIVQITDDLEFKPGWLHALVYPLISTGKPLGIDKFRKKWICALLKGHNTRSHRIETMKFHEAPCDYEIRTNAAAYCWAFWRLAVEEIGLWKRAHFADTRWKILAQREGYTFILPQKKYAQETNLNYLRPWNYKAERRIEAKKRKLEYLKGIWSTADPPIGLMTKPPVVPTTDYPLKNPEGIGPGSYPAEWLSKQKGHQEFQE